jgi:hypothetical protein
VTSNVVTLPVRPNPDAAWARYQALAARLIECPRLALDRGFMTQLHIADAAFKASLQPAKRVG